MNSSSIPLAWHTIYGWAYYRIRVVIFDFFVSFWIVEPFSFDNHSKFAVMYNLMLVIARIAFKQLKEFDIVFGK